MFKLIRDRRFLALAIVAVVAALAGGAIAQTAHHRSREKVRIVRGNFDVDGNILAGAGFTVEIESSPSGGCTVVGAEDIIYHIQFDPPFRSQPTFISSEIRSSVIDVPGAIYCSEDGDLRLTSLGPERATTGPIITQRQRLLSRDIGFIAVGP